MASKFTTTCQGIVTTKQNIQQPLLSLHVFLLLDFKQLRVVKQFRCNVYLIYKIPSMPCKNILASV